MKTLLFIFFMVVIVFACENPWKLVYTNGNALAVQQDSLIKKLQDGEKIDSRIIRELKRNWWVMTAYRTCPGNLVIRQYCIIDIAQGKPSHKRRIKVMLDSLTIYKDGGSFLTYAEGYSYWKYTKEALDLWLGKFKDIDVAHIAGKVDSGFAYTSYFSPDGLYYPAPFGDLRKEPLDIKGQNFARAFADPWAGFESHNVSRMVDHDTLYYLLRAMPVGLNNHCDKKDHRHQLWTACYCRESSFYFRYR